MSPMDSSLPQLKLEGAQTKMHLQVISLFSAKWIKNGCCERQNTMPQANTSVANKHFQ
jgi:hypothetical protein